MISDLQQQNASLEKQRESMKLALEEKELDLKQMKAEQELLGKRSELVLRKKQVELDACRSLVDEANSIVDATDFCRLMNNCAQFNVPTSPNSLTIDEPRGFQPSSKCPNPTAASEDTNDRVCLFKPSKIKKSSSKDVDLRRASCDLPTVTRPSNPLAMRDTSSHAKTVAAFPSESHLFPTYGGYRKFIDEVNVV